MSLKPKLEAAGIESSMLDDMVHEAASRKASAVNNEGMSEQLGFIQSVGYSDQEIAEELGISLDSF